MICLSVLLRINAQPADPENILLEGYTFTRPATWKWEAPRGKSISLNRFVIPAADGKVHTDVGFFYVSGVPEELRTRVLSNFDSSGVFKTESVAAGKTNLIYVRAHGTAIIRKTGPLPNHELLGTMLHSKQTDKWFFVRMLGPRGEIRAAEEDFKNMIKQAIEDAD